MSDDEIIPGNGGEAFVNCPILVVSPSLRERREGGCWVGKNLYVSWLKIDWKIDSGHSY